MPRFNFYFLFGHVPFLKKSGPKFGLILCVFLHLTGPSLAQDMFPRLSARARVSVLTCGPGEDLYAAFGHSAIRIQDPGVPMDLVFNYGMFSYNQENFYLNFARGYMRYSLGYSDFTNFAEDYRQSGRSIREQVLNLDSAERQAVLHYLGNNLLPQNREYYYNYFRDNCSTRIVDLLDSALQHRVVWNLARLDAASTFRARIHDYTIHQPWGELGIDLGLGSPIDHPITPEQLNFLPEELERNLNRATLLKGGIEIPLVRETRIIHETALFWGSGRWEPGWILSLLFTACLSAVLGLSPIPKILPFLRILVFFCTGTLGLVLSLIWFFTNHVDSAWNFNLLWANPIFWFLAWSPSWFARRFPRFRYGAGLYFLSLAGVWFLLPQDLHPALFPLVLAQALLAFGKIGMKIHSDTGAGTESRVASSGS